jgi:hypothetical protein
MTGRWSFEALAVNQFKNNDYKKLFIDYEIEANPSDYIASFLIDELVVDLHECMKYRATPANRELVETNFRKLAWYINILSSRANVPPAGDWINSLNIRDFNAATEKETRARLEILKRKFRSFSNQILKKKGAVTDSLISQIGAEGLIKLKENYENEQLNFIVLDEANTKLSLEKENRIIQKYRPGYMKGTSRFGRAHFYAPVKQLGNLEIDTYWFNTMVLWAMSLILFVALYFELFRRAISFFENLGFKRRSE